MFFRKLLLLEDTVLAWTDGAAVVVLGKGKKIKFAWGKSYVKLATHLLLFEVDLVVDAHCKATVVRSILFDACALFCNAPNTFLPL